MSREDKNICKYCGGEFKYKQGLIRHQSERCKVKNKQDNLENIQKAVNEKLMESVKSYDNCINELNLKIKDLQIKYEKQLEDLQVKYEKQLQDQQVKYEKQLEEQKINNDKRLQDIIQHYEIKNVKLENTIEINQKFFEEFKQQIGFQTEVNKEITIKAIENAGPKTTNTINNKNQIYNALEPLTDEHMRDQAQHLTYQNITNGAHGIAHFASNYTFKGRVMCSDKSRLNFVFKNENNVIIKDPEGVEITKKFIEINREELLRLLDEYFAVILKELDKDLDIIEYKHWSKRREEIIATKSAVKNGNVLHNQEYYSEFKYNFLSALSDLVPR